MLTVIDEFTRRCLAIVVARKLRSDDVLHCLTDLFVAHGPPEHIRSDNGPEFVARNVREWLGRIGVKTLFIEPGSPWENGYCESFNSKLRDELLAGEQFSTLHEAKVLIEQWRQHYNAIRPHSSLGYRPPAPETILPPASALPYAALRPAQTLATSGRSSNVILGIETWGSPGSPFEVLTISAGVAAVAHGRHHGVDALVEAADKALYSAKSWGRDRVALQVLDQQQRSAAA